jgi:hypothetical protein
MRGVPRPPNETRPASPVAPGTANRGESLSLAATAIGPESAGDDLKRVYQEFAKRIEQGNVTFGCLFLVIPVLLVAIIAYPSFLALGFIGVLGLFFYIVGRLDASCKKRASARVSQLERQHGLSHQESFHILLATRSGGEPKDASEWEAFVTEVWGADVLAAAQKKGPSPTRPPAQSSR